jgi:hypothetical protein
MTTETTEKYDEGVSAGDFIEADDPPDPDVSAGDEFTEDAPYGWRRDHDTGQMVPRKKPGRPRRPPGPDDLVSAPPVERQPDPPPGAGNRKRTRPAPDSAPPMPKGGVIAAQVNKLYRRAGKIMRAFDHDTGQAVIECTRPEDLEEGEMTVGEAWEQLARTNPRIRAFIMRAVAGGAWGDLVMAHAPIGIALIMKPAIQRLIPFGRLVESVAEPDDDTPDGEGGLPGGMTAADFDELREQATEQARRMAERMHIKVSDAELEDAAASVGVPPGFNRHQRRAAATRARRKAGAR